MKPGSSALKDFLPAKPFFIGLDSDGCALDSMEAKHKRCFAPAFVEHFELEAVGDWACEVWAFVNLYSQTRGINRFPALARALRLLREHPGAKTRGGTVWDPEPLEQWIQRGPELSTSSLQAEVERGNAGLRTVLDWSLAVNRRIAALGVAPLFPLVRESLERVSARADVIVVSQTPKEALAREWKHHGMGGHVRLIAGQELGSKTEQISATAVGRYPAERMLVIGDAPGDLRAARATNARFYPIIPGQEAESWRRLHGEVLDRFLTGRYTNEFEAHMLSEFGAKLPEKAAWERP